MAGKISPERALWLLSDAARYRARAEELRTAAEDMTDDYCKQTTYRLAADYERMAKHAEHRASMDAGHLDGAVHCEQSTRCALKPSHRTQAYLGSKPRRTEEAAKINGPGHDPRHIQGRPTTPASRIRRYVVPRSPEQRLQNIGGA